MEYLNITYVSDLDYGFNHETGAWDVPCVEWEDDYGKHWERFESEEARNEALAKNEAYNNQPHVKAQIEAERKASDVQHVMWDVEDLLDRQMELGNKVELSFALGLANLGSQHVLADWRRANQPHVMEAVARVVALHNKLVLKAKAEPKPTTFCLGDLM